MKLIVISLVLLATTLQCQGNLSLFGGILSSTHERVHDVAGAVLGTINKGLNFNFDGHLGVNEQKQPSYGYQHQGQQNEYDSYYNQAQGSYGYRPNQNGVQQPSINNQRPHVNNGGYHRPQYNGNNNFNGQYGNEPARYPNNNYQNYPNNNNYGYNEQQRPNNQNYGNENGYSDNQNQGYNYNQNQGYPNNHNYQNNNDFNNQNSGYDNQNNDNENNVYGNEHNGYNDQNSGLNYQNNFNKPNFEKPVDNGYGTPQGQKYPEKSTTTSRPRLTPPTTTPNIPITNTNDENEDESNSENSSEDAPLFIPLGQDEYVYGGDQINITSPKREADNKPPKAEEEDFPIDIRFGN